jgi:CheY-like chemotaxis protein
MIYLIDDNKRRQQDSGWSDDKFQEYKDFIFPIYRLFEVTDDLRNELFRSENNVILFHESFFENIENRQDRDVNDIRNRLEKLSNKNSNICYVVFSGSNSERKLNEINKSGSIPVHILYNNLEVFIQQYQNTKEYDLKYLLFGNYPEIEPLLLEKLNKAKRLFIEESSNLSNLLNDYFFFRSRLDFNPLNENHTTIYNKDSQLGLNEIVIERLSNSVYKGIFVPLCFGSSLSDFNGLRLATEIRCTNTINQGTPIFIYNFAGMEYLLQNEYFNILKTKGVEMVDYSKKAFENAASRRSTPLKTQELPKEIKKLELQPPKNYLDKHSIANEWSIHQWAKTIGCDETDDLKKVFQNVDANLYFKYLRTINPILEIDKISHEKLKIKNEEKIRVMLIDDEASKGWSGFYSYLFRISSDKIKFKDSGIDFKSLNTKEEIFSEVKSKVLEFEPDIVLLDLRLIDSDFYKETQPTELTGLKVLEKIKSINKGIQVIIITASNKAWNFNLAKHKGAYDFIIKDGYESPVIAINKLCSTIECAIRSSFYLKPIFKKMQDSLRTWNTFQLPKRKNIINQFHDPLWHVNLKIQVKDFVSNAFDTINNESVAERFTISILMLYRVIEMMNEFYIIESGDNRKKTNQYYFDQDNSLVPKITFNQGKYLPNVNVNKGTYFSATEKAYAISYKNSNKINSSLFKKIYGITRYRNEVAIHPDKRFREESLEYIYENDFRRFNCLLNEYFSAILEYINSFK